MSAPGCYMPSRWTTPRQKPRKDCAFSSAIHGRLKSIAKRLQVPETAQGAAPRAQPAKSAGNGGGDGDVSLVMMLDLETEVEMKLPGRFKVSPQIAGAIKAVSGVVDVQTL